MSESPFRFLLPLLLAALIAAVIYRAFSMSMTWDEAYTVCVYAADFHKIFSPNDFFPNNHIPHTLLVELMFQCFPWQEGALRLPAALLGCGTILLLGLFGLRCFASSPYRYRYTFLLVALVCLHPLVFQFLSFARGYSASLFFSLLGFYLLHNTQRAESAAQQEPPFLFAGLAFGLSVAFNLSSALMNASLIAAFLLLEFKTRRFTPTALQAVAKAAAKMGVCGAVIVLIFYAPLLFSVPWERFNYASDSLFEGMFDMGLWTLGNSNAVLPEHLTRLIFGVPVSEETFLMTVFLLVICGLFVLGGGLTACFRCENEVRPLAAASLGMVLYFALLLILEMFGKAMSPKDRTGILPVAYLLMIAVMLLAHIELFKEGRRIRQVLLPFLFLLLFQFLTLFELPYYHNFWYADNDVRTMMKQAEEKFQEHGSPKRIVCLFLNETAVQYYKNKYAMDDVEYCCVHRLEELDVFLNASGYTLFLMAESVFSDKQGLPLTVLSRNRYSGVALMEKEHSP